MDNFLLLVIIAGSKKGQRMYYNLTESGKRIRNLREKKQLTQETMAEMIGVSQQTITFIENGKRGGSVDTLLAIAEVLESSLDYIVSGEVTGEAVSRLLMKLDIEKQNIALKILKGIIENL